MPTHPKACDFFCMKGGVPTHQCSHTFQVLWAGHIQENPRVVKGPGGSNMCAMLGLYGASFLALFFALKIALFLARRNWAWNGLCWAALRLKQHSLPLLSYISSTLQKPFSPPYILYIHLILSHLIQSTAVNDLVPLMFHTF